ncbi:MAG: Fe-S cluster assembly sulfur transfer protein SufU [Thermoanaerobaculia bacterium]
MNELQALYQEVLLDHYRRPRNQGRLDGPTGRAEGNNPLCGDRIAVEVKVEGQGVEARLHSVSFESSGCAISTASASLMTEATQGMTLAAIEALFTDFRKTVTGDPNVDPAAVEALGKLAVLAGVKDFPMRVKCATLAWHTLLAALAGGDAVSTE